MVRVEALPTPSEHIPALVSRVEPIYLARTYNLQVPESRQAFNPEEVLDKLARMKGKLLRGGEPDLDGVAKVLFSDWVRGKILHFVTPPERPEELNKVEEAKRERGSEGKEERMCAIEVRQNLGSIVRKNGFIGAMLEPSRQGVKEIWTEKKRVGREMNLT